MKSVSDEYRESMASQLRGKSRISVSLREEDKTILEDGSLEFTDSGLAWLSNSSTIENDYKYQPTTYATFELNRWNLDGSNVVAKSPNLISDGFISYAMTDENVSSDAHFVARRTFSKRHTISGITLVFDNVTGEYPDSVSVNTDGLYRSYKCNGPVLSVKEKMTCNEFISFSIGSRLPHRRPRLKKIIYGTEVEFTQKDMVYATKYMESDPLSRRTPKDEFSFTIWDPIGEYAQDNPDGSSWKVDKNAAMTVRFGYDIPGGDTEWLKEDEYRLTAKPVYRNMRATFNGVGLFQQANKRKFYKSQPGRKDLYSMAKEVFEDCDAFSTNDVYKKYSIDDSLKKVYTNGILPVKSHLECLQIIAHAGGCYMKKLGSGQVAIRKLGNVSDFYKQDFWLDKNVKIQGSESLTMSDVLDRIEVSKYSYNKSETSGEISKFTTEDESVHIDLPGMYDNITVSVSGGSVLEKHTYAQCVDMKLSAGSKTVTISGKSIKKEKETKLYSIGDGTDGEVDYEDNPLITSNEAADALEATVASYLRHRKTYDTEYRGNPEVEHMDCIHHQTDYKEDGKAIVLSNRVDFQGYLSGKMIIKEVD